MPMSFLSLVFAVFNLKFKQHRHFTYSWKASSTIWYSLLMQFQFSVTAITLPILIFHYWRHIKTYFPTITLVFKNNFSLFCHINQNFNVLLYKSFNKFPSDTKITIMLHRRTLTRTTWTHAHTYSHRHTCIHTHKTKCAVHDLALWTCGAVCIDLLVWVAMQCNNRYVCRMTSLSLRWAALADTGPRLQI